MFGFGHSFCNLAVSSLFYCKTKPILTFTVISHFRSEQAVVRFIHFHSFQPNLWSTPLILSQSLAYIIFRMLKHFELTLFLSLHLFCICTKFKMYTKLFKVRQMLWLPDTQWNHLAIVISRWHWLEWCLPMQFSDHHFVSLLWPG